MDYNEMLFALQLRQQAMKEIESVMPESMSQLNRMEFMQDNIDGYILDILEHVHGIVKTVRTFEPR